MFSSHIKIVSAFFNEGSATQTYNSSFRGLNCWCTQCTDVYCIVAKIGSAGGKIDLHGRQHDEGVQGSIPKLYESDRIRQKFTNLTRPAMQHASPI